MTQDTNVSKHPELAKYVTQEEIDGFAFRYWHIDYNSIPNINLNQIPKNKIQEKEPKIDVVLKLLLKSKQTDKILKFISDNNLSIDHTMYGGVTPIMYSAYWNDTNTTQELINLGADIRKRDKFGLWSMAYAIANNSVDVVKLFIQNGVKFTEVKLLQGHLYCPSYYNGMTIVYDINNFERTIFPQLTQCQTNHAGPMGEITDIIGYLLYPETIELAKIALKNGLTLDMNHLYEPYAYRLGEKRYTFRKNFETMINFDEVLNLVLDSNVNMDLFVSKDEIIQEYTNYFESALRIIEKTTLYLEHTQDFILGENVDARYGGAYLNYRVAQESQKARGEKYDKIIDNKHIKIPIDNLILDKSFYGFKSMSKYFNFLNDINLDYIQKELNTHKKYKEFAKEMKPKFDKWLENRFIGFATDKNATFDILKDYFDIKRNGHIGFAIDKKEALAITIYNGKVIDYDKHIEELNKKYSNTK